MHGRHVLLTAGPTFEPLDPVRGLTNSSSGKMGFALARACAEAGAEVTLVCGPVSLATPRGVRRIDVQSALDMRAAVLQNVGQCDIFIGVAAVADYRPLLAAEHKIKKGQAGKTLTVELVRQPGYPGRGGGPESERSRAALYGRFCGGNARLAG